MAREQDLHRRSADLDVILSEELLAHASLESLEGALACEGKPRSVRHCRVRQGQMRKREAQQRLARVVQQHFTLDGDEAGIGDRRDIGLAILILVQIEPDLRLADRQAQPARLDQLRVGIGGHRKMHEATSEVRPRLASIEALVQTASIVC